MKFLQRLFQLKCVWFVLSSAGAEARTSNHDGLIRPSHSKKWVAEIVGKRFGLSDSSFISRLKDAKESTEPFADFLNKRVSSVLGQGDDLVKPGFKEAQPRLTPIRLGSMSLVTLVLTKTLNSCKCLTSQDVPKNDEKERRRWWQRRRKVSAIHVVKKKCDTVMNHGFYALPPECQCAIGVFSGLLLWPLAWSVGPTALFEGSIAYLVTGVDSMKQSLRKTNEANQGDDKKTIIELVGLMTVVEAIFHRIQQRLPRDIRSVAPNVRRGYLSGVIAGLAVHIIVGQR